MDNKSDPSDDPEIWTDADTYPVPSKIFKAASLRLDVEIEARVFSRKPRLQPHLVDRARAIGRRTLEVAIGNAVMLDRQHPVDWRDGWTNTAKSADSASSAIRGVFQGIDPDLMGRTSELAHVLVQTRGEYQNVKLAVWRARRDVLILRLAERVLNRLNNDCRQKLNQLSKVNPRVVEYGKEGFVQVMVEGWIYLTGVRPGSTTTADQNPFVRFVEAGWQDWTGTRVGEVNFVHALNKALAQLTDRRIETIKVSGPSWL